MLFSIWRNLRFPLAGLVSYLPPKGSKDANVLFLPREVPRPTERQHTPETILFPSCLNPFDTVPLSLPPEPWVVCWELDLRENGVSTGSSSHKEWQGNIPHVCESLSELLYLESRKYQCVNNCINHCLVGSIMTTLWPSISYWRLKQHAKCILVVCTTTEKICIFSCR